MAGATTVAFGASFASTVVAFPMFAVVDADALVNEAGGIGGVDDDDDDDVVVVDVDDDDDDEISCFGPDAAALKPKLGTSVAEGSSGGTMPGSPPMMPAPSTFIIIIWLIMSLPAVPAAPPLLTSQHAAAAAPDGKGLVVLLAFLLVKGAIKVPPGFSRPVMRKGGRAARDGRGSFVLLAREAFILPPPPPTIAEEPAPPERKVSMPMSMRP